MSKSFSIYCSGGASRILKFYSDKENFDLFRPRAVIYDGSKQDVLNNLKIIFGSNLYWIDHSKLKVDQLKRIHGFTSGYIHNVLIQTQSQYLICFGDKILKKALIEAFPKRLINFHPSILPAFKGVRSIDQALDAHVSLLGNTAHFINEGVDEGEIILQSAMLAEDFEDYEDILELQLPMLKIIFRDLLAYDVSNDFLYKEIKNRRKGYLIPKQLRKK